MDAISRLLKPRSVAVIGASADPAKTAGRPVAYLRKHGYRRRHLPGEPQGRSHRRPAPATPTSPRCRRCPMSPSCCSAPSAPTCAVRDLAARGTRRRHRAGQRLHRDRRGRRPTPAPAASKRPASMRILGPNTIGLVNLTDNIVLSADRRAGDGPISGWRHRRGVAERRHPGLAAVARRGARHRPVQADLDQQRSRPGTGRLHRPPGRRPGHQGHRAVCRDGAQPGDASVPLR